MRKGRRYYGSAFLFLEGFIFPKTYFRKPLFSLKLQEVKKVRYANHLLKK